MPPLSSNKDTAATIVKNDEASSSSVAIDVGVNLTHEFLKHRWRDVVKLAVEDGVDRMIQIGTTVECSKEGLEMANAWHHQEAGKPNLFSTVGVHPCEAHTFRQVAGEFSTNISSGGGFQSLMEESPTGTSDEDGSNCSGRTTIEEMTRLLQDPFAVAIGECGLDYHPKNPCSREQQLMVFREQVHLACHLQLPLFCHERNAHGDFLKVLDDAAADGSIPPLPPILVHCFTGSAEEAVEYVRRGFYISLAGMICKKQNGEHLREYVLPTLPLECLMVETDAPYMAFRKQPRRQRRQQGGGGGSEPSHVVDVALKIAEVKDVSFEDVCRRTTENARSFFRLDEAEHRVKQKFG